MYESVNNNALVQAVEILMEAMERPSTHTTKVAKEKLGPMVMWAWALQNSYATYFEVNSLKKLVHVF